MRNWESKYMKHDRKLYVNVWNERETANIVFNGIFSYFSFIDKKLFFEQQNLIFDGFCWLFACVNIWMMSARFVVQCENKQFLTKTQHDGFRLLCVYMV